MKSQIRLLIAFLGIIAAITACQSKNKAVENLSPIAHQVTAEEVIQTSSYTYVRVSADGRDYWIAVSKAEVKQGETYFWSIGSPMKDFWSKELKRNFRTILFVQDFTDKPITLDDQQAAPQENTMASPASGQMPAGAMTGKQPTAEKSGISVPRADGGITIGELFAKRNNYSGKQVKIRGEVVRFAGSIMGKNWAHLQDGTKDAANFDLTVTTLDSVKVGNVVVFQGVITLNKDFGAGYSYEVIMEEAKQVKK